MARAQPSSTPPDAYGRPFDLPLTGHHEAQAALTGAVGAEVRAARTDAELTRNAVQAAIGASTGAVIQRPSPAFEAAVSRIAAAVVAHTAASDAAARQIDRSYTSFVRALASIPPPLA